MKYNQLIQVLLGFGARECARANDDINVQTAQLMSTQYKLSDGITYYNRDFLFVGYTSELPELLAHAPRDAICIEDVPVPPQYVDSHEINLILTNEERTITDLLNCVVFNLSDDFRILRGDLILAGLTKDNLISSALLAAAYTQIHNPIMLLSPDLQVLASVSEERFIGTEIVRAIKNRKFSESLIQQLNKDNNFERFLKEGAVSFSTPASCMLVPIVSHGFTLALLLVQCSETMFFYSTYLFMDKLRSIFVQTTEIQLVISGDKSLMHTSLFIDLINKEHHTDESLRSRIEYLGWKKSDSYCLFLLPLSEATDELRLMFSSEFSGCHWMFYQEALVFLIPLGKDSGVRTENVLSELCTSSKLRGVLSGYFLDLLDVQKYYLQIRKMLELANQARCGDFLITWSEMSPYLLAETAHSTMSPENYIPIGLYQLIQYDSNSASGLLDTLECYLRCGGITSDAIKRLNISKSTAFYRLGKIRDFFCMDLENGLVRAQLQVALCSYRLYGV